MPHTSKQSPSGAPAIYSCKLKFSLWYPPKDEDDDVEGFGFWDDVIPEFLVDGSREANFDERTSVSMWETMERAFNGAPEAGIIVETEDKKFGDSPRGRITITANRISAEFRRHDGTLVREQTFEDGSFRDLMGRVSSLSCDSRLDP